MRWRLFFVNIIPTPYPYTTPILERNLEPQVITKLTHDTNTHTHTHTHTEHEASI